ncbi:MAG: hypothetical protein ACFFDH_01115 [Promethearchaeota archaeon]
MILGIIFELFLFFDLSGSITYTDPSIPGEDLINDFLVFESIAGILVLVFLISIFIFDGIGFLIKSRQSIGVIRKNFLLLSLGTFVFILGGILDGLFSPGIYLIFVRSTMAFSALIFYFGLKQ